MRRHQDTGGRSRPFRWRPGVLLASGLLALSVPFSWADTTNLVVSSPSTLPVAIVAPQATTVVTTFEIDTYIDGRDHLVIDARRMQWHHLDFAAVGRHFGADAPTLMQSSVFPNLEWLPEWPEPAPAEIRYDAWSDFSPSYGFELPMVDHAWMLLKLAGRGDVTILEQPSSMNGYKLIVDFNDNPYDGGDFYGVRLTAFPLSCE